MIQEFLHIKARALFQSVFESDSAETGMKDWSALTNWMLRT